MAEPAESASTGRVLIAQMRDAAPERYAIIRRVTLVGAGVDLVLAVGKIGGGFAAHSQSLVADGVHSLSDLVTDLLVLLAAEARPRQARRGAPLRPRAHRDRRDGGARRGADRHRRRDRVRCVQKTVPSRGASDPGVVGDGRRGDLGRVQGGRVPLLHARREALSLQAPRSERVARAQRRRIVDRRHHRRRRHPARARLPRRDRRGDRRLDDRRDGLSPRAAERRGADRHRTSTPSRSNRSAP